MSEKNNSNINTRRNFLKQLGLGIGAAGAVSSISLLNSCSTAGDDEMVNVLTADGQLVKVSKAQLKVDKKEISTRGRKGIEGKSFVMVIDLAKCKNARKCMSACQNAHHLKPEQHHINVLRMQEDQETAPYFMPKPCQQCDNPPCTKVCPVDATFKRDDGIVLIDNERCIGCRFCIAACPYSARIFNWEDPKYVEGDENRIYDVELNVPQKKGTISKCLFSADRLRDGKLPYCVSACPNGVYWFGDKNEDIVTNGTTNESVRFSELLKEKGAYTLMPELGTKPRVYYLPEKNRKFEYEYNHKEDNWLDQEELHPHG